VRVGPNEVITNDPEVLRKIMGVRSTYTRGHCRSSRLHSRLLSTDTVQVYNAMKFDPTRDNLFSMRDEVAHTKLRAKMAAGVRMPCYTCKIPADRPDSTLAERMSPWKALLTHKLPTLLT
jgi:hypothetical protein